MGTEVVAGGVYECFVNGRVLKVRVVSVAPFGLDGVKIVFVNAETGGRKMERYSSHDFRPVLRM